MTQYTQMYVAGPGVEPRDLWLLSQPWFRLYFAAWPKRPYIHPKVWNYSELQRNSDMQHLFVVMERQR